MSEGTVRWLLTRCLSYQSSAVGACAMREDSDAAKYLWQRLTSTNRTHSPARSSPLIGSVSAACYMMYYVLRKLLLLLFGAFSFFAFDFMPTQFLTGDFWNPVPEQL